MTAPANLSFPGIRNDHQYASLDAQSVLRVTLPDGRTGSFLTHPARPTTRAQLLLLESLPNEEGKHLLEIGVGPHAILPLYVLRFSGYSRATGSDIDLQTIVEAEAARAFANERRLELVVSDVFEQITGEFDAIVSNPPQTPKPRFVRPINKFDYGGPTGYDVIQRIIEGAPEYLAQGGALYLVLAEYLGIERRTGDRSDCLFERMRCAGLVPTRVATVEVPMRQFGVTWNSLWHIKSVYPDSQFGVRGAWTADAPTIMDAVFSHEQIDYRLVVVKAAREQSDF